MRIKATKNPLELRASIAAAALAEAQAAGGGVAPAALPFGLAPPAGEAPSPAPAGKPAAGPLQPDFSQLAPPRPQGGAAPPAPTAQTAGRQQAAGGTAPVAAGRPVRKRKQPAYANDMIPTDVLSRRGPKSRPSPNPPPPRPATTSLPAALAAAGMPAALQLVTMNTPDGGTVTGLAAVPASQLALLRAQGGAAGQAHPPVLPYKLVAAATPPAAVAISSAAAAAQPPAVRVAAPRDVAQVAKQLDEEERRKVLAASDARVVLRVLPGAQAAARGGKGGYAATAGKLPPGRGLAPSGDAAGRGRSGNRARRPTPDLTEQRLASLPPGTWHPGFEAVGGVTLVSVLDSASAPPLPAVAVEPARLSQPLVVSDHRAEVEYSSDPLRASLEFLHHAATTVGQQPQYSSAAAAAVGAEQRAQKERLARVHFARDHRRLGKERVEGTRKSVRMRAVPEIFVLPPSDAAGRSARTKARPPRPEDETDVILDKDCQVDLPVVRPRPAAPTPDEERYLAGRVCGAGDMPPPAYDAQQTAAMPAASKEERDAWVDAAHEQLKVALGPQRAARMGVLSCGRAAFAGLLSEGEEAALEAGMREFGRAFHTIRAEALPQHTVYDLQNYYFNVWKLQATPRAKEWYKEKAAEEAARAAEQERLEAVAAAEAEAQRKRQEERYRRRMLREVVTWVKAAARAPGELQNRPTVVQRVQRAAKLVGSLNAAPPEVAVEVPAAVE